MKANQLEIGGKYIDIDGDIVTMKDLCYKMVSEKKGSFRYLCNQDLENFEPYEDPDELIKRLKEENIKLQAKLDAGIPGKRSNKERTVLTSTEKFEIAKLWKHKVLANEKPQLKYVAADNNMSPGYLAKVLKEQGVYEPGKKIQKPTHNTPILKTGEEDGKYK